MFYMAEITLTAKTIQNLGLWNKVCEFKGWDYLSADRVDDNEMITFDDTFQKEEVVLIENVIELNKKDSILVLDLIEDAVEKGLSETDDLSSNLKKFMKDSSDGFEWQFENLEITIKATQRGA